VRPACDAENHGQEDHRRNQHLDQGDESVTQRTEGDSPCGPEVTEQRAANDGAEY
jgi:hypothetical protein